MVKKRLNQEGNTSKRIPPKNEPKETPINKPIKQLGCFRSNLTTVYNCLKDVNPTEKQEAALKRTPFWNFVKPFIRRTISKRYLTMQERTIVSVLLTYDQSSRAFNIGPYELILRKSDFELIFGIISGEKEIIINSTKRETDKGVGKLFKEKNQIFLHDIREKMSQLLVEPDTDENATIFAQLTTLIVLATYFIPSSSQYVSWGWIKYINDFENLLSYDWSSAILEDLNKCLGKMQEDVRSCKGCLPFLVVSFF